MEIFSQHINLVLEFVASSAWSALKIVVHASLVTVGALIPVAVIVSIAHMNNLRNMRIYEVKRNCRSIRKKINKQRAEFLRITSKIKKVDEEIAARINDIKENFLKIDESLEISAGRYSEWTVRGLLKDILARKYLYEYYKELSQESKKERENSAETRKQMEILDVNLEELTRNFSSNIIP